MEYQAQRPLMFGSSEPLLHSCILIPSSVPFERMFAVSLTILPKHELLPHSQAGQGAQLRGVESEGGYEKGTWQSWR
jgi:hypothetical protein